MADRLMNYVWDDAPATKPELIEGLQLLELAKAGYKPPKADWENAPLLSQWREIEALRPAAPGIIAIEGIVTGHHTVRDGEWIRTTPLLYGDNGKRFVRTLTSYYQLGSPAKSDQH